MSFDIYFVPWAAIDQLPGDYASDVRTSINAGIDMLTDGPSARRRFLDASGLR